MTDSSFVKHTPCPECGSSDANSLYDDGHAFCFACNHYTPSDDVEAVAVKPKSSANFHGEYMTLSKRQISQDTCRLYRVTCDMDRGQVRFHYLDESGTVVGCKTRDASQKQFRFEGTRPPGLWGAYQFPDMGRRIVITEGEFDALSCYEVMPGWPMVSLPTGSGGAKKAIQESLPKLQGYDQVVLFFDNDEAGREAVQKAVTVLPPGKAAIATLNGYKDASEALQAGARDAIRRAIWDAKPYRPDGIVDGQSLRELLIQPQPEADYSYSYPGLNDMLLGIRKRELVTLTAGTGIGKSTFCQSLAASLLQQGHRVGYIALEESNRRTALGLMSVALQYDYLHGVHTHDELLEAYDATMGRWPLYLFDGFGSYEPDVIYNRIEYLASGLDTSIIFLDHLSILMSGLEGDERRMIDQTMTRLRSLVERTNISLFLVSHLKSPDGATHEEGGRVKLAQLRGSRSIGQLSDAVIGLERDQQALDHENVTTVRVLKNRFAGETGVACRLRYDKATMNFYEITPDEEPFTFPAEEAESTEF